jgi:RimJ/RimL family protein N-acetyltransferase
MNDPKVCKYLETGGNYRMDDLRTYLLDVESKPDILFWAIHLKQHDKHIGNIKIDPVSKRHGLGEYGVMMGERAEWGKGYAFEASNLVIDHCFEKIGLRKITLGVVEENESAVNLYKKLGFVTEGIYKAHGYYSGHYCDLLRMAIFNPVDNGQG